MKWKQRKCEHYLKLEFLILRAKECADDGSIVLSPQNRKNNPPSTNNFTKRIIPCNSPMHVQGKSNHILLLDRLHQLLLHILIPMF